jgi:E3 ubiquitin-protein ligase DOA10
MSCYIDFLSFLKTSILDKRLSNSCFLICYILLAIVIGVLLLSSAFANYLSFCNSFKRSEFDTTNRSF